MTWPTTPLGVTVEIYLGPVLGWVDITADVRLSVAHSGGGISITRGRQDWGQDADFSTVNLVINNRSGKYSNRNPRSEYYGILSRNTPVRVRVNEVAGSGWVNIPTGGQLTTPDVSALDITGDIDIRVDAALSGWQTGTILAGKYATATNDRSWIFTVEPGGLPRFYWSPDGTFASRISSTATTPITVPASGRLAVRVTLDVNNGASGNTTTFYAAPTLAGPWTQLGSPVVKVGTTSIHPGGDVIQVGREDGLATPPSAQGRLYGFQIRNGIGGTAVADLDLSDQDPAAETITDTTGLVWTLNETDVVNPAYRIVGEIPSWPPEWDLSQNDRWVPVKATGIMRRLGKGARPVQSPLYRYWSSQSLTGYWPLEDADGADQVSSGLPGGTAGTFTGNLQFGADDTLAGASRSVTLPSGAEITVPVVTHPTATSWSVAWCWKLPQTPAVNAPLLTIRTTGTVARWEVYATSTEYHFQGFDSEGAEVDSAQLAHSVPPTEWVTMQVTLIQDGANVDWYGYWHAVDDPYPTYYTGDPPQTYAGTIGTITSLSAAGDADAAGMSVGHLVVAERNLGFEGNRLLAAGGFRGETAGDRARRLGGENGVPVTIVGDPSATAAMGTQRPGTLLELLRECATADGGGLFEDRGRLGLLLRTRGSMYNQPPVSLDYAGGHIAAPFRPVPDDQLTANDITVSRRDGGSVRVVQESGPLNVNDPADDLNGVGVYAATPTINVAESSQLPDHAGWLRHLGTWDEDRYAQINVDLSTPGYSGDMALTAQVVALDSGDILQVENLPVWVPPGPASAMVQGYTETIDAYDWDLSFNATPGGPWTVGVVEDDVLGRADTDGSKLLAQVVSGTDTTAQVVVTDGPTWITRATSTHAAMFPFDIRSSGVVLRVLATGQILNSNAFFETDVSGWGATTGATIAHSTAQAHSGTGSMLITPDGVTAIVGATVMQSAQAVVSAGVDYLIAGWLRSSGAVSDARMAIDWYQSNGTTYISSGLPTSIAVSAGVWTYYAAVVTSPALAARARLRVRLAGTPSGSIWADECVLIPVGSYAGPGDNFTRSVAAGGWGTSSTGHTWALNAGTAGNFSVTGTVGRMAPTATNDLHLATIDVGSADADPTTEVVIPVVPTGAAITIRAVARYTDTANYYYTELTIATTGLATLKLFKRVSSTATQLGSSVVLTATHAAGDRWVVQCSAIGDTIRGRACKSTSPVEPGWHVTETDTALTSGTRAGVAARRETGNTDGTQNIDVDNFAVPALQTFTVDQAPVNGVARTIPAGEPLSLATPWRLAL